MVSGLVKRYLYIVVLVLGSLLFVPKTQAQEKQPFLCELGLQGGCGYYVGDAAPHIFMYPREAYGVHFRYKFTKRWALQVKASGQRITAHDYTLKGEQLETMWQSQMVNVDVMAEFNFFRFGSANKYDKRIRPYTPYIFLGIAASVAALIVITIFYNQNAKDNTTEQVALTHSKQHTAIDTQLRTSVANESKATIRNDTIKTYIAAAAPTNHKKVTRKQTASQA